MARLQELILRCKATFEEVGKRICDFLRDVSSLSKNRVQERRAVELPQYTFDELIGRIKISEKEVQDHKLDFQIQLSALSISLHLG